MPAIRYRLLPGTTGKNAMAAAASVPAYLDALVGRIIEQARTNVVKRTPVGWSGNLRDSYGTEIRRRGSGSPIAVLTNPAIYHDFVEDGRKPGRRPPVEALIPWVGSKLGVPPGPERRSVAFLVARKIGQAGTPAQRMVAEGWAETRKSISPELKQLGLRLVGQLKD